MRSTLTNTTERTAKAKTTSVLPPHLLALDHFAIPFFCYACDGRRTFESEAARAFPMADPWFDTIGTQADYLAGQELAEFSPLSNGGQLQLRRVLPCRGGMVLAVYVGQVDQGWLGSVVVVRPGRIDSARDCDFPVLSRRELDVANLVAAGLATKEVAYRLNISTHTARHHTEKVFAKLGVRTRSAVASLLAGRSTAGV